ncbi:choline transporter-like 1 isoform X2 [Chrysoperla carnea]|uniref:choline transporter-like 1 isoform X2 n=1 Tax=Chrysoperla carnea TaxID=189513 RepID=UPI001D06FC28|nr:choline transporter-like 1 isoform X2 [Chrysoperla carnea]
MGCCVSKVEAENSQEAPTVRGCTDVLWLCLFIGFWFLMILIAAFAFVYGSPQRLINGYDSFGNTCGTKNSKIGQMKPTGLDMTDKSVLFFMDIRELRKTIKICVKQCPTRNLNTLEDLRSFYKETGTNLCRYDFNFNELDKLTPIQKDALTSTMGPCPKLPVYESIPVLNRCVPKPVKEIAESVLRDFYGLLNSWDTLEQILGDLYNTWKELLFLSVFALIMALFTVSILHLLATLVSVIIMILVCVTSIGGTGFLWYTYFEIKGKLDVTPEGRMLLESVRNESAFLTYSIIATVITIILLLLMLAMCKRVDVLAELFKETAKCLGAVPGLFLQPLITFVVLLIFFGFWLLVVLCLATSNYMNIDQLNPYSDTFGSFPVTKPTVSGVTPTGNIAANEFKMKFADPTWVKYMWWVYFIGLIWTAEFIMACQSMVIAGAVAHWFYRNRYKNSDHVSYAVCKLMKYHLGSVAKGSFLITLFKIPRLILTYLYAKLQKHNDAGSEIAKCFLRCCICCFYCLERFIRYLNHNAYTVIAIDGVPFCSAAATAFEVLSANALTVATINSVGDFILFLGKCFVTAITGTVGLYFFKRNEKLTFYAAPTLVTCIFAFFIAHCILSLYEMVLDSLYLCRCQNGDSMQVESTNGSADRQKRQQTELEPIREAND